MTPNIQPTQEALWHELISDAEKSSDQRLEDDLKSYLVCLLMRFLKKPDMISGAIALEYLNNFLEFGEIRKNGLRDIGDKCLIFSGFFPKQTRKRRVSADYFISIGQSAYLGLSEEFEKNNAQGLSDLYMLASRKFITMATILMSAKMLNEEEEFIDPLLSHELWERTHSPFFKKKLKKWSESSMFFLDNNSVKH